MRAYVIAPQPDYDAGTATETSRAGFREPFAVTASAAIATVAAFFPRETDIRLCDEIVEAVDFDAEVDLVAISMNISQVQRGISIARRFRARGVPVVMGGSHVSLEPEIFRGEAECLVIGEFEPVAEAFMADLFADRLRPEYHGGRADLASTPVPRWDLYPNQRTIGGVVQTSRGCPFECSFCDVIQYLGRKQRHKPAEAVVREAQVLYDHGYREISLSDDNFTVYRQRTRALLAELIAWNGRDGRAPVRFNTQMSIDAARDPELLELCNRAGLRQAFIGLETDNAAALQESRKRQNLRVDLVAECEKIVAAGVTIRAGLIVGFDSDDLSCFERVFGFAMALPIVGFNVNVLVAPVATPLFDQMKQAGRIVAADTAGSTMGGSGLSNILPLNMTREQLSEGRNWLKSEILSPENTIKRFERYAGLLGKPVLLGGDGRSSVGGRRKHPLTELVALLARDRGARQVIDFVRDLGAERPEIGYDLTSVLTLYLHEYALHTGRVFGSGMEASAVPLKSSFPISEQAHARSGVAFASRAG